ncbi:MAG: N-acetylmuramoyl-L-alanine amidase [Chloroflexota bacterium]
MKSKTIIFAGILLLFLLSSIAYPAIGSNFWAGPETEIAELYLSGVDFMPVVERSSAPGFIAKPGGVALDDQQLTGVFTSQVIEAPIPFNVVVPQWIADVPIPSSLTISVRTGNEEGWGDWINVHENHDWTRPEDPDVVGEMVIVPATDVVHQYLQYSVSFGRYADSPTPILRQLHFTFIDSTAGPTHEEMMEQQAELNANRAFAAPEAFPKPNVISRDVWCVEAGCDYSNGLQYENVTNLILHHTVTNNNSANWPAVVRAIWKFHKDSRGWGDIGYNYLVDMNGVLYEGHHGGDDVIGTHAADANRGTMALALIGNFTLPTHALPGIQPPQPMLESAADLFAWKVDQKGIEIYGATKLPYMDWGLPNIMGHRDVYGGTNTECPGEQAFLLLPWLRDAVAERIDYQSPHIYVDELSENFSRSNQGSWYEPAGGCGNQGHAFYTFSVTNPDHSTNWGEWTLPIPVDGVYEIEAYAPYCTTNRSETDGATYDITHAGGTDRVVISHDDNIGLWMSLGEFPLTAVNGGKVRLTDITPTDTGRGVWFDALRLRLVDGDLPQIPETTLLQPQADVWVTQPEVTFSWEAVNTNAVEQTWLQVATDPEFVNLVYDQNWPGLVLTETLTFTEDTPELYWRVVMATASETVITDGFRFGVDTLAPETAVHAVYSLGWNNDLVVAWSGQDSGSGLANYTIEYRAVGTAVWQPWLTTTTAIAHQFIPPDPNLAYEFRSQAVDNVGHIEPVNDIADTSTQQAKSLPHAIMVPFIRQN